MAKKIGRGTKENIFQFSFKTHSQPIFYEVTRTEKSKFWVPNPLHIIITYYLCIYYLKNISLLCRSNGIQSSSGISSATSTPEEQEAKLKAEKIKLAIEKIKEANIKKIFIKVFTSDGSAKSLLVDEKMSVSHVTRILAEKNHVKLGKQI